MLHQFVQKNLSNNFRQGYINYFFLNKNFCLVIIFYKMIESNRTNSNKDKNLLILQV